MLSCNPAWLKFLPKPGAWMEKFKIAMGFPMLATAVWLFNVASSSYGKNVLWLGVFLVVVAFAAWIFGEFVQRGRNHKTAAAIIALFLLIGGYAFALEKELDWREAMPETDATGSLKESPNGIDWQPWSPEAVAQARAAGKPVLVDFTADWCLTCQVNKKLTIEIPAVRAWGLPCHWHYCQRGALLPHLFTLTIAWSRLLDEVPQKSLNAFPKGCSMQWRYVFAALAVHGL